MRILLFTENDHAGGMDTFIFNLVSHWPHNDQIFLVCNTSHPGLRTLEERLGGRCTIVKHDLLTREKVMMRFGSRSRLLQQAMRACLSAVQYVFFLYHIFEVRRMIAKTNPDRIMIVAGNYPGGSTPRAAALYGLLRKARKPIFVYHNDPSPVRWFLWLPECMIDWLVEKSVFAFVTVSNATQEKLSLRPALARSKKKRVIYNGIPLPTTSVSRRTVSNGIREELGIAPDVPLLLMLGTYEPRKGHEFLFDAFKKVRKEIPNAHLVVAGYGYPHDVARVKQLVNKKDLREFVHLLGFRNDVPALLNETDMLVVPSRHSESFGLMIVEAMAHKVPVVATRVGGIPEVLREGQGGYTVPLDVNAFAHEVVRVLKDKELWKILGEAGYGAAKERFDVRRMAQEYYHLVQHGK